MSENCWVFGLSASVVQDGDFTDLEPGQKTEFAVELLPLAARTAPADPDCDISSKSLKAETREFVGELAFARDGAWVMDVGIRACGYQHELPLVYGNRDLPEVRLGDRFVRRGSFHVLPGAVESHFVAAPPHRYSWRIDHVELDTTPWIEDAPGSWVRDRGNVSYRKLDRTDAWHDDKGRADDLLRCSLRSGPHA